MKYDLVIVGGGPAGLSAGIRASEDGLKVLILEEREYLGGILPQCVHPGFGLHYFREDLTGPEFAHRLVEKIKNLNVDFILESTVLDISVDGKFKVVKFVSPRGLEYVQTLAIIYAAGARERHRFEIGIYGDRVAGVFTAGEAQTLMDIYGIMPGRDVVIVGSGDVGLIMARRFALEGARVRAVIELMPYPGGLARNVVQCLEDFNIPLYLSHRVLEIRGRKRVEYVRVARVDEGLKPIEGTEFDIPCDTVVISAGLVPRTKLLKKMGVRMDPFSGGPVVDGNLETTVPGVFVAGNALMINDLVDYVVEQGELAAQSAVKYINGRVKKGRKIPIVPGNNVRFAVPHYILPGEDVILYARVERPVEDSLLVIKEIGLRRRYPVLKPSEMVRIKLSGVDVGDDVKGLTLEVQE